MKKKKQNDRWAAHRDLGVVVEPSSTEPEPSRWEGIREWLRVLLFISVVFVIFGIGFVGMKSCSADLRENHKAAASNKDKAPFKVGDLVQAKVSDQLGYVIAVRCSRLYCEYDVRFNANASRTDVQLFGADGVINNYPIVLIKGLRDFELKKAK